MRPDIKPGATFPDYELLDHENVPGASARSRPDWTSAPPRPPRRVGRRRLVALHGSNRRTPPTPSAALRPIRPPPCRHVPGWHSSDGGRSVIAPRTDAVAIVTGGSPGPAARSRAGSHAGAARSSWSTSSDQRRAEATVAEILAAEGTTVAVRADLADDLDVQRLFAESIAAFGGVDVVVHTTSDSAVLLYQHAARHVRRGGAIVSVSAAERVAPGVARQLRERGITVGRAPPDERCSRSSTSGDGESIG